MLALGIICLLIAAALVLGVLLSGTSQEIVFNSAVGDFSTRPIWVFLAGAVAMLLVLLGLSFFGRGTRKRVARRKEMRRLRKVEQEHTSGPVPTTRRDGVDDGVDDGLERGPDRVGDRPGVAGVTGATTGSTTSSTRREGFDEPDRELVREPRPTTTQHTDVTQTETSTTAATDESSRHRDV